MVGSSLPSELMAGRVQLQGWEYNSSHVTSGPARAPINGGAINAMYGAPISPSGSAAFSGGILPHQGVPSYGPLGQSLHSLHTGGPVHNQGSGSSHLGDPPSNHTVPTFGEHQPLHIAGRGRPPPNNGATFNM